MIKLKQFLFFAGLGIGLQAAAQKKPANFLLGQWPAANPGTNYSIAGFGNNYMGTNYNLRYGQANSATPGFNRTVKLFDVEGETYSVTKAVPGQKPFNRVIVRRNSGIVKTTALFETESTPPTGNNSTIYLTPDYVATMEDLINSYVINRGTDNVFINGSGNTTNNIERIDMILETPLNTSAGYNLDQSGFLLMERGGNDAFKVSAITGLTGDNVTGLTATRLVERDFWGNSVNITSVVMQRVVGTDENLKPSQNIGSQSLSGVFIPLSALNLPANAIVYGISMYASDVNLTPAELLTISNYPANTPDSPTTNGPGLDFMAGGGFFTKAILINGSVWHDADANAIRTGGEQGLANGLWANLVDADGNLISSVAVDPDGSFKLFVADNNIASGNYKVILTNQETFEGSVLTSANQPQNGYGYTGTNYGGSTSTANRTGIIDIGPIGNDDITGVNFGIRETNVPVSFATLNAGISQNLLKVQWSTVSEAGNDYFDVEVSANGEDFQKIGSVKSKAPNGYSNSPLSYEFEMSAGELVALGSLLFLLVGALATQRRKKWWPMLWLVAVFSVLLGACMKTDADSFYGKKELFLRIKQVDKDGQFKYSKVVKVMEY